jgi:sugar lactone lactonase YvrE
LNYPLDVIVDKNKNSLIICDQRNIRVVRWSRQNSQDRQILIERIVCWGLAMDNNEDLYVSNWGENEVRRWAQGDKKGTIVAGGNKQGNEFNQLHEPQFIFVDESHSVYVTDRKNARVMKWIKNATEGIPVASKLRNPSAVIVDHMGNIYIADTLNPQIMRWSPGAIEGNTVVGGKASGSGATQFRSPFDLSFDRQGNLYVVDYGNDRIQKFIIDFD